MGDASPPVDWASRSTSPLRSTLLMAGVLGNKASRFTVSRLRASRVASMLMGVGAAEAKMSKAKRMRE